MLAAVNAIQIHYEKSGSGQPLILLHGNGESNRIFDKAIPILSQHFTVYALDTRGHGKSGKVDSYHYADMAEDVRCFIETLGLQKPILYGFSDGGIIGLMLAAQHPNLLSRLITSGVNIRPDGIRNGWLNLFKAAYALTKDPKIKMMLEEPDIPSETLQKITIPTIVLAGSRDMVKQAHTEQIAGSIKGSTLRILKGEGHTSYVIHKSRIAELILESTSV